ncbi:lamin tail domain-containing protein [bacterium]|nr:lamin tail domain-containing protein [bacterium]
MRSIWAIAFTFSMMMLVIPLADAEVVINELSVEPGSTGELLGYYMMEWVELFNDGPDNYVGGWILTDREAVTRATLPVWTMPGGAYLTVHFGEGVDDDDFSDGEGHYFVGDVPEYYDMENGECALYNGAPSAGTIVDFVAWGHSTGYMPGIASTHALIAGIWSSMEYVSTDNLNAVDHLGRAFDGFDTDGPGDFIIHSWQSMLQHGSQQPSNPIQISPVCNRVITETMPTFDWYDVESVDSYRLQVIPDTHYNSPIIDIDGIESSEYTPDFSLPGNIYTWRVSGDFGDDSTRWSREWSMFVDDGSWPVIDQGGMGVDSCPHLYQRKDSKLLCISHIWYYGGWQFSRPGCLENTQDPWDAPHPNGFQQTGPQHGLNYCVRASIAMINHKLGGDLLQDRISYYFFHEWQDFIPGPEGDLGHSMGCYPPDSNSHEEDGLSWALNGATIDVKAKPTPNSFSFDSVKTWIDQLGCFMARDLGHMFVINAYTLLTQGSDSVRLVYINDPKDGPGYSLYSASVGTTKTQGIEPNILHVFLHPQGWTSYRSIEAACTTDTDGDGVMDFDEENRFLTSINSQDSDSDGVHDKQEIRSYTFHGTDHPTCPVWNASNLMFPDIDADSWRAELDWDTDNDSLSDGAEDIDGDGISPEAGETCVYDSLNVPPPVVTVVAVVDGEDVVLSWFPVATATGFNVYGDTIPFSTGDLLDTVIDTTWTDYEAVSSRPSPYFYYVTATVE